MADAGLSARPLDHVVGSLRRCVIALSATCGTSAAMRRVINDTERLLTDVERLDIDADELRAGQKRPESTVEKITITDTPYDPAFWRDVDDEGLGGTH
ncbi:hypothetical protein [Mycolicibacterium sp.]|uniref:hypothetical protein n=1 Tax=Mycolicibacterium sp. TaxID=2320850 RepID=UPI0037C6F2B1